MQFRSGVRIPSIGIFFQSSVSSSSQDIFSSGSQGKINKIGSQDLFYGRGRVAKPGTNQTLDSIFVQQKKSNISARVTIVPDPDSLAFFRFFFFILQYFSSYLFQTLSNNLCKQSEVYRKKNQAKHIENTCFP